MLTPSQFKQDQVTLIFKGKLVFVQAFRIKSIAVNRMCALYAVTDTPVTHAITTAPVHD